MALGDTGQNAHSLAVEARCHRFVVLGGIYGSIGDTVDNHGDVMLGHHLLDGCLIGDVEPRHVVASHISINGVKALVVGQHMAHLMTQLAVGACDEYMSDCHDQLSFKSLPNRGVSSSRL